MYKNVAGQKLRVFAFNVTTNRPVLTDEANITCKVSKDNAAPVTLADTNPIEVEDGYYLFDLTQDETNGDTLDFYPESSTSNVVVIVPNFFRQTVGYISYESQSSGSTGFDSIIIILRTLIQDLSGTTYSSESLTRLIITAAIIVKKELYFPDTYTIDILNGTITPDPTDETFIFFVAYKASIMLISSELRKYSNQSIKIKDGPSTIDLSGTVGDFKTLLDSLIEQYDKMKRDYTLDNNFGYAVITPTTVEYISPSEYS